MPALDPTLEGAARSTLGRMQHDLADAARQDDSGGQAPRRDAAAPVHRTRARSPFPTATRRSATIGFVSFLNQYGPALVDRLDEELPLDLGQSLDCRHLNADGCRMAERAGSAGRRTARPTSGSASPRSGASSGCASPRSSLAVAGRPPVASPPATTTSRFARLIDARLHGERAARRCRASSPGRSSCAAASR